MGAASRFPIVEYQTRPIPGAYNSATGGFAYTWDGTVAVDLRWVAAAQPWTPHQEGTEITLCGAPDARVVRADYADFMRDWCRAKGV